MLEIQKIPKLSDKKRERRDTKAVLSNNKTRIPAKKDIEN